MSVTVPELLSHLSEVLEVDVSYVDEETRLFSSGIVDSFALAALIGHIEDRTGIRVDAQEITLEHFDTLTRMLRFIKGRQTAGVSDPER